MEKGGSRLLQMQAKFQQKQMQEREMKIASLYEAQQARALDRVRQSPTSGASVGSSPPQPVNHQPGKVRQMFEERRTKAGIDKSYPLQPIHNTERPTARKPLPNGYSKVTTTNTKVSEKRTTKTSSSTHTVKKQHQHKIENIVNGSGDLNHNHEQNHNSTNQTLPKSNGEIINTDELDKADNNELLENETFPEALAPAATPRSPEPQPETHNPPRRSPPAAGGARRASPVKTRPSPPRRVTSDNTVSSGGKAREVMHKTVNPIPRRHPVSPSVGSARSSVAASGARGGAASGAECVTCGRHFAPDRIVKHQEICRKAHTKKRKPFDALKHRLAGTEAEPFINKLRKGTPSNTKVNKPMNSSWRQKHEEFIQAIRAAKQVQAHLNAGGKLSDLPPPPPSENPDYVQCPHCSRRFNQGAAERHIPKCASFQFNKPKPPTKRR